MLQPLEDVPLSDLKAVYQCHICPWWLNSNFTKHQLVLLHSGFVKWCEHKRQMVRVTNMGQGSDCIRVLDVCIHSIRCHIKFKRSIIYTMLVFYTFIHYLLHGSEIWVLQNKHQPKDSLDFSVHDPLYSVFALSSISAV